MRNRKKNSFKEHTTRYATLDVNNDNTSKGTRCKRTHSKNMFASRKTRHLCVDIVLQKAEDVQSIIELEMAAVKKDNALSSQLDAGTPNCEG
jgi:hypothetical protein